MADQMVEIDEALAAVEDALDCLDAAARDLKSASNWGWADMFGGGFLLSMIKHGKIETANQHLHAAQAALARMARELGDVPGFSAIGPNLDGFLTAADFFFDNAFMDAMVQQRISEGRARVAEAIAQCEQVREQLLALKRPGRSAGNGLPGGE